MSRLTDLITQASQLDPKLGAELAREFRATANKRSFGLVFERHLPEAVELPTRPVRRGDTVHVLPPRGSKKAGDDRLWTVAAIDRKAEGGPSATLVETKPASDSEAEVRSGVLVEDLVVVAQHDDVIYPGLVQTGEVVNSDDPQAPFHTVINSENLHALNLLTYTHRHKVDCIYIDPPYNTGAKDWKYNNDYVDGEDAYRHSKWLSFMEKRLELARELLNPEDSVVIVTIDEKEYLRLGMLLEQMFPEARIQMVSSVINPAGAGRTADFSRTDEYLYFVQFGGSTLLAESREVENVPVVWDTLRRSSLAGARGKKGKGACGPNQFYPIYVNEQTGYIDSIGEPIPETMPRDEAPLRKGCVSVFPVRPDGTEMNWGITPDVATRRLADGHLRAGRPKPTEPQPYVISYLTGGIVRDLKSGKAVQTGVKEDGSVIAHYPEGKDRMPTTHWDKKSHDAQRYGTEVLKALIPKRVFPFPKSLYAVEDALAMFLRSKPNATILDFFSGSGTTAHAVMRLNKQDGGHRRSISVTNNEVSFEEAKKLTKEGFRPGDPEWERLGICDYVTKPRIQAAITGKKPDGDPIKGDYKFTDEFPMKDGFEANARFFTLTYEPPTMVRHGYAYAKVAPLLWLRAGQFGRVIEMIPDRGWDVAESHGVIKNIAAIDSFAEAVAAMKTVTTVYVITDDALAFQSAVAKLKHLDVEPVQLYSTYLTNFAFTHSGGGI